MDLQGNTTRLTNEIGNLYAPEISPNGKYIVFTNDYDQFAKIWIMNRDGGNPHEIYRHEGSDALDPSWSPDGSQILFAVGLGNDKQLHISDIYGANVRRVDSVYSTRGRSDWSPDGLTIASYTGESWYREIFLVNIDGSNPRLISDGGNVLAPNFSPDGMWIAITGYIDRYGDDDGCEIYIMRIDGSDMRRLTNNTYCDWQPQWGN